MVESGANGRGELCEVWEGISGWGEAGEVSGGVGVLVLCAGAAASTVECAVLVMREFNWDEAKAACFGGCGDGGGADCRAMDS